MYKLPETQTILLHNITGLDVTLTNKSKVKQVTLLELLYFLPGGGLFLNSV